MLNRMFATIACRSLLSLMLLMPFSPRIYALDTSLPDLGNSAGSLMTPKRERDLGKAFMRSIRRSQQVMDDALLTDYVQQLGQQLVSASDAGGTAFNFFMIDDPQINAFAGPGGNIGVFSGLVLTSETESELAAVFAHEIAHVTQQHLLRAWESASALSVPNAALLLAAVVLGAAVGGDAAAAAAIGGQAALIQQQINFTRANEKEADRVGIDILANAGFEPRAMPAFFSRMGKANRVYASKLPEFLMTHPVTTSRTADALGRAEQFAYRQNTDDLRYQLVRMELTQRQAERPDDAVRELQLMLDDGRYRNQAAVQYGIARARLRAKQPREAAALLDTLLTAHPRTVEFIVSRAQADILADNETAALARLQTAIKAAPGSYALNIALAEAALAAAQPATAERNLGAYLALHNDDPRIYQLLSRAANDLGKRAEGHAYLAEYYYLTGDAEAAVVQLDIALEQSGISFFDASRFESRRAELQREVDDEEDKRSARR